MLQPTIFEQQTISGSHAGQSISPSTETGHGSLALLVGLPAVLVGSLFIAWFRSGLGDADLVLLIGFANNASVLGPVSLINSAFSLLIVAIVSMILVSERRVGSPRLACMGWLVTALGFSALAVLLTPALHQVLPQTLPGRLQRMGLNADTLAYPVIAQFGFGILIFLWSRKSCGLNARRITAGFLLLLAIGVMYLVRDTSQSSVASVVIFSNELNQTLEAAGDIAMLCALALLLTAFAGYLNKINE